MSEDLQSLLEKINREGVEKAQREADAIVAAARAKADELVKAAKESAAAEKAAAEKAAADYEARARVTLKQAARDTVKNVAGAVQKLLVNVLAKDVDAALADKKAVGALAVTAVKGLAGPVEVAVPAKLVPTLKAQLAAQKNVTVVLDETLESGFSVKIDGGRVEHAFTTEMIAGELAKHLRPDLAALLK